MTMLKYLDIAIKFEKKSAEFYTRTRNAAKDFNTKMFLNVLMEKEIDHLVSVVKMRKLVKEKKKAAATKYAKGYKIARLKNPFAGKKELGKFAKPNVKLHDIFRKAVELEQKAHDFYMDAAANVSDKAVKAYLKKLAKEELQHKEFILEHEEALYNDGYWLGVDHVRLET